MSTKVITGKTRFSYEHLLKAQEGINGGEPKYSVSILIPKDDKKTLDKIKKAIEEAKKDGVARFGAKFVKSSNFKTPLRDGDADKSDDPAYENCYFLNVSSKTKPGVVDKNLNPIIDPSEIYSGCYGRASIVAFPYSVNGSNGISFALQNVQKLEDGEPLGGKSRPEDDFEAVDDDFDDDILG
jgi:hypothetical protein